MEQPKRRGRRPGHAKKGPHPVDVHVGSRVRLRRNTLGLSQEKLGEAIGLTFQQVQKYERGANRISASRLLEIARVLDVSIAFFYDDVDPVRAPPIAEGVAEPAQEDDLLQRKETVELVTAYYEISDTKIRGRVFELAKALAASAANESDVAENPSGAKGTARRA